MQSHFLGTVLSWRISSTEKRQRKDDYYEDSFDSFESGSEHDSDSESAGWKPVETRLHVVQDPRMKELMSSMTKSGKSGSDLEEGSNSSTPHSRYAFSTV